MSKFKTGVISGKELRKVFNDAKENNYALPAVNVTNTSTVNSVLETAAKINSPVIIQFSSGGCQFFAGKGLSNKDHLSAIAGGISGAMHVHEMAKIYNVTTILHTDHCARKILPWVDGLLDAGEKFYESNNIPLFSSHMIDLSEEPIEENIEICKKYLKRMSKIGMTLEIELGVTGGEEWVIAGHSVTLKDGEAEVKKNQMIDAKIQDGKVQLFYVYQMDVPPAPAAEDTE